MKRNTERQEYFLAVTERYSDVIAKVCWLYAGPGASFDDLYQEVLANLWQGLDSFRGEAKLSTWIYRAALNTCITWHRRNGRHGGAATARLDDVHVDPVDNDTSAAQADESRRLLSLIARLAPLDKALVTLWLDEKSYEEIAIITGISAGNVAVRFHRAKEKLAKMADELHLKD